MIICFMPLNHMASSKRCSKEQAELVFSWGSIHACTYHIGAVEQKVNSNVRTRI